jgi:hypothetical protein
MVFEIEEILASGYLDKTFLIAPPRGRDTDPWEEDWEQATESLRAAGLHVPPYSPGGLILSYETCKGTQNVRDMGGDIRAVRCMHDFVKDRLVRSPAGPSRAQE